MNRYRPHVLLLPEDGANRQIANGFLLHESLNISRIRILPEPGGWLKVVEEFEEKSIPDLAKYPETRLVLVIDCDRDAERLSRVRGRIPHNLSERVFVIGCADEPETLRTNLGRRYEEIGRDLANDCYDGTDATWSNPLLQCNGEELVRLRNSIRPILFD